jgi:hypothetical protein
MMSEAYENLLNASKDQNEESGFFWWVASRVFDKRQLRILAVRFVRQTPLSGGRHVEDLLTDQRSLDALTAAERYANGEIGDEELSAARAAAGDAAWEAAWAARAASREAAGDAAWAAWETARAAWAASREAAGDAAWEAARAAGDAAWEVQKQMIRDLGNPFLDNTSVGTAALGEEEEE